MKFLRAAFSLIASMSATVFGPIWSHPRTLRAISKVFWKDLWKDGCIDIHNHLLWGIDDGSKSFEETIALSKGLQELGITKAIATPHTLS